MFITLLNTDACQKFMEVKAAIRGLHGEATPTPTVQNVVACCYCFAGYKGSEDVSKEEDERTNTRALDGPCTLNVEYAAPGLFIIRFH